HGSFNNNHEFVSVRVRSVAPDFSHAAKVTLNGSLSSSLLPGKRSRGCHNRCKLSFLIGDGTGSLFENGYKLYFFITMKPSVHEDEVAISRCRRVPHLIRLRSCRGVRMGMPKGLPSDNKSLSRVTLASARPARAQGDELVVIGVAAHGFA